MSTSTDSPAANDEQLAEVVELHGSARAPDTGEAEWRGDRDTEALLVDGIAGEPPRGEVLTLDDGERPPIVPAWLRSKAARHARARAAATRRAWWLAFHVSRLHVYWLRLAARSPRGAARVARGWYRLTVDRQGRESIVAIRSASSPDARGNLDRAEDEHWRRIKERLVLDAIALVALLVLALFWLAAPLWFQAVTVVVGLAGLGALGRAEGAPPILERVVYKGQAIERPTADLVTRALANAMTPIERAVRDNPAAVNFRQPPTTLDTGAGYRMVLELPGGVTVEDCTRSLGKIAGGLSRDAACLAIEQVPPERGGHAAMAELTVLDAPMRATSPPSWPLAEPTAGPIDIFKPIPVGVDLIGRTVSIDLMFRSAVVGAQPRVGKTFTVRLFAGAVALDPRAELHIFDLKGGVDFRAFGVGDEPGTGVVHSGGASLRPEVIAPTLEATVRYLLGELRRRSDVINSLPVDRCPEGKVTSELANDRALGLHPVFVFIDETQFINDWPNADVVWAGITELAKAGPSYGICILLASQQVNSNTIPRSVSTMAGLRFCLSVADTNEGNLILGGGASKRGYRPDYLTLDDKGIGYLAGEGAEPRLMRSFFVDGPAAAKVAARARQLREQAGRLTGHAAGETEAATEPGFAALLAAVWPEGRGRVSLAELAALLAGRWPDRFGGWDAEQVGAAARAIGLTADAQVKRQGQNLRGLLYQDVNDALTDRDHEHLHGLDGLDDDEAETEVDDWPD